MELFATAQRALNRAIRTRPWMLFAIPAVSGGAMFALHPYLASPLQGSLHMTGARDLGEGVGAFLTVVGVIYALIIGFTFQQAFGRQAELRQKLTAEASSLRNLILLTGTMRGGTAHEAVDGHVLGYVEQLLDHEFPPDDAVDAAPILYRIVPVLNQMSSDGVSDKVDRITLNAIHDELRATTRARSERLSIAAIEIVRIRPQVRADEDVDSLIEDPWRRFECEPDPQGCAVTFEDTEYPESGRDALYYARAIQEETPAINGANLRTELDSEGNAVSIEPCYGDYRTPLDEECLAPVSERAWSSPIFLDQPRQ